MLTFLQRLVPGHKDETGASAVEYGLLVAAIAALIVVAVFGIGKVVSGSFTSTCTTLKARANDTTDIHLPAGGTYAAEPSRPFQSTTIDHIQAGKLDPTPDERRRGANLGLYSITPNNNLAFDYVTLQAYKDFRLEAERKGFRHFLEVFDPNACGNACPTDLGRFINDLIVRTLAGVPSSGRPRFLKIA